MSADAKEAAFQQDIIDQLIEGGWQTARPFNSKNQDTVV